MRIRLSTDSSTASASSWHTVQFRRTLMQEEQIKQTHEQKKSGTTLTTRKAPFATWNPQIVSHELKKKTEEDRETRTDFGRDVRFFLRNYGNGTEVCFESTVTILYEIKEKKIENRGKKREMSHLVDLIGERSTIVLS